MARTKIEWSNFVWNPVTGCTPVSEGCLNCYARRFAQRLRGRFGYPKDDPFRVTLHPERLTQPYRWRRGVVFVCSMGDLFHEEVPSKFIQQVLGVAADPRNRDKIFCFLTKRSMRMCEEVLLWKRNNRSHLPSNWWLGVSVENQERLIKRGSDLLRWNLRGAHRFISAEPLLEPLDIKQLEHGTIRLWDDLGYYIELLIVGAETGPGRRPCDIRWVRQIRDDCATLRVRFFLKQVFVNGKKTNELDGVDYSRISPWQVFRGG